MHVSIPLEDFPCEFININPLNPLISKCQIKVCYVGDEPNRNRSVITKEVARSLANSLPGSPIVGFFNEDKEDFEEHNRIIDISNGQFKIKDTTRPYGFVDLNAKVWFQKFLDDGVEHEYLVTEGYLWTGQYPETQRILENGNNHSMELDEKTIDAYWSKDNNGKPQFFIINEAIISKLCILGENVEPCFEGSQITKLQFSFEDSFKEQLFSMMNEMKKILNEGGALPMFTTYAVEIGDALWSALYSYIEITYPGEEKYCSAYRIEGVYEENSQKFAILQSRKDMKYFRLDFSLDETSGLAPVGELVEVTKTYTPSAEPQFALEAVEAYEVEYAEKKKADEEEEEEKCPECGKPLSECTCEDEDDETKHACKKDKKAKYNLEEIPEYMELTNNYNDLQTQYNALLTEKQSLETQNAALVAANETLTQFKASVDKKEKEAMIAQFYMLSDEDKKDVIENIDTYSLDDIEAKLSIICVRNKVNFNLDEDENPEANPITFNLNSGSDEDEVIPAWVKAAMAVAKTMN